MEEKFEPIAIGQAVAMVPQTVAASDSQHDLVYLPVTDAEPVESCIAAAADRHEHRIQELMTFAAQTLKRNEPAAVN